MGTNVGFLSITAVVLLLYEINSSAIVLPSKSSKSLQFPTSTYGESPPNSITANGKSTLENIIELSFKLHQDVVISNLDDIAKPPRAGPSRFVHRSVTWISLDSERQLPSVARRLQQVRHSARYSKIPRLDADYFVFHVTSDVPPKSPPTSLTFKVKYGLVVRHVDGATTVNRVASYYPTESTVDPEQTHHFPDFTRNFHGTRMRITLPTFAIRAAVTKKEDGTYRAEEGGYAGAGKILAAKLNFTPVFSPSSNGGSAGIKLKNGTWTGAAGDILYGRTDIVVALVTAFSRLSVMDYSLPLERLAMTFVNARPRKYFDWRAILKPLHWTTYLLTAVAMVTVAITFTMDSTFTDVRYGGVKIKELFLPCKQALEQGGLHTLAKNFSESMLFLIASTLVQASSMKKRSRILTSIWLLAAIVICTAYQSKLFYFMAFPIYNHIPDTFDELADSDYKPVLWSTGGSTYSYLQKATSSVLRKIFSRVEVDRNMTSCLIASLQPKTSCITYTEVAELIIEAELSDKYGQSPFHVSSARTFPFYLGIATEKHSILQGAINSAIVPAVEMRIYERLVNIHTSRLKQEALAKKGRPNLSELCAHGSCYHEPPLGNLVGVFYFLVGGWVIAISVALIKKLPVILKRTEEGFRTAVLDEPSRYWFVVSRVQ